MVTDTAFYRNKNYHEKGDVMETLNLTKMACVIEAIFAAITWESYERKRNNKQSNRKNKSYDQRKHDSFQNVLFFFKHFANVKHSEYEKADKNHYDDGEKGKIRVVHAWNVHIMINLAQRILSGLDLRSRFFKSVY